MLTRNNLLAGTAALVERLAREIAGVVEEAIA